MAARDFGLAARRFREALEACPGNRAILLALAEAEASRRDYAGAIRAAQEYLASDPSSSAAHLTLAGAYLMTQRLQEAVNEAELVLKDQPANRGALKIRANAAYLAGDSDKAKETLIRLLEQSPGDEDGAYMLGRVYYQEEQIELAMGQFERVLRVNPSSYKALDNLGLCYEAKGDEERALRYFLTAIKLVEKDHPQYEWPYINLSELFLKKGEAQRAFDAASKAANRNPSNARGFYAGAKALDQLGKPELAANWLERATSLDGGRPEYWYLLSRVYRKLGQGEKSGAAERKFLALKQKEPAKRR
jgi:tetratricopeptide (TPR) repeat protein